MEQGSVRLIIGMIAAPLVFRVLDRGQKEGFNHVSMRMTKALSQMLNGRNGFWEGPLGATTFPASLLCKSLSIWRKGFSCPPTTPTTHLQFYQRSFHLQPPARSREIYLTLLEKGRGGKDKEVNGMWPHGTTGPFYMIPSTLPLGSEALLKHGTFFISHQGCICPWCAIIRLMVLDSSFIFD